MFDFYAIWYCMLDGTTCLGCMLEDGSHLLTYYLCYFYLLGKIGMEMPIAAIFLLLFFFIRLNQKIRKMGGSSLTRRNLKFVFGGSVVQSKAGTLVYKVAQANVKELSCQTGGTKKKVKVIKITKSSHLSNVYNMNPQL